MITILTLTPKQKKALYADCGNVFRALGTKCLTRYYDRQTKLLTALYECQGLTYSEYNELTNKSAATFAESLKFAKLNDELTEAATANATFIP